VIEGLDEVPLRLATGPLPEAAAAWLRAAQAVADEFYGAGLGPRFYRYVPSDPVVVYRAIESLQVGGELRGTGFCELGCGFGIAAGLAELLGCHACGIEWEEELCDRARALRDGAGLSFEIFHGGYLPEGFGSVQGMGGKDLVVPGGVAGEQPMFDFLDPAEVDLFFVYPWPDEEEFMAQLFSHLGAEGAVLLIYQGEGEISAWRGAE
jgi:SAM-dependent methyltransferase